MKKRVLFSTLFFGFAITASAQMGLWTQRDTFPAGGRSAATGFNVGTAAYVACGIDSAGYKRSNWLYNPATDLWTQMQSLGGVTGSGLARDVTMSFVIGNDAYVVGGQGSVAYFSDTWKYDAFNDVWTQVQNFNGGGRRSAVSFAINGKGYVALGQASTGLKNDCWEYNPSTNIWTQKALFPGTARRLAVAFVINNIAYVGTGDDGVFKNDFYAYDPAANNWTAKAAFAGTPRYGAVGFAINGKGYVGFGYDNTLSNRKDFYEYNPASNSWTAMNPFQGTARANAVAVSCPNNKAYVGLGYDSLYRDDWWEFDPTLNSTEDLTLNASQVTVFPNPMTDQATVSIEQDALASLEKVTVTVFDLNGKALQVIDATSEPKISLERGSMAAGIYLVCIQTARHGAVTKQLVVR
jgi:N-acetylneuraminic acid mutarotase